MTRFLELNVDSMLKMASNIAIRLPLHPLAFHRTTRSNSQNGKLWHTYHSSHSSHLSRRPVTGPTTIHVSHQDFFFDPQFFFKTVRTVKDRRDLTLSVIEHFGFHEFLNLEKLRKLWEPKNLCFFFRNSTSLFTFRLAKS